MPTTPYIRPYRNMYGLRHEPRQFDQIARPGCQRQEVCNRVRRALIPNACDSHPVWLPKFRPEYDTILAM